MLHNISSEDEAKKHHANVQTLKFICLVNMRTIQAVNIISSGYK